VADAGIVKTVRKAGTVRREARVASPRAQSETFVHAASWERTKVSLAFLG